MTGERPLIARQIIARGDVGGLQSFFAGGRLTLRRLCSHCGAWHGVAPRPRLARGQACDHDRMRPCRICGQPVGNLTMGGPDVCAGCDLGERPRKETPMAGTNRGTITKSPELTAMQRVVDVLQPLTPEAQARVLEHVKAILAEPAAPKAPTS
jgi:hypothetical protein